MTQPGLLLLAQSGGTPAQKSPLPAPAISRVGEGTLIARLKELMHLAAERETKQGVTTEGWTGVRRQVFKKVPTARASESHTKALELAREILACANDRASLLELRSVMASDAMYDMYCNEPRFAGQPAPLVQEIDAKLATVPA